MKKPERMTLLRLFAVIDLTFIAVLTYRMSDPLLDTGSLAQLKGIQCEGAWFMAGIILGPLFCRE